MFFFFSLSFSVCKFILCQMAMESWKNIIAVSLLSDYCCWWRIHANFNFCVMRKERHKSGLEKKKKLFRKRNFSSGWVRWAQSISHFSGIISMRACFFSYVYTRWDEDRKIINFMFEKRFLDELPGVFHYFSKKN